MYIAGDNGRDRPFIFPDHRPNITGASHGEVRRFASDDFGDTLLMYRVPIRMKERDDPAFTAKVANALERGVHAFLIERFVDRSVEQDAFLDAENFFATDKRCRAA